MQKRDGGGRQEVLDEGEAASSRWAEKVNEWGGIRGGETGRDAERTAAATRATKGG